MPWEVDSMRRWIGFVAVGGAVLVGLFVVFILVTQIAEAMTSGWKTPALTERLALPIVAAVIGWIGLGMHRDGGDKKTKKKQKGK